MEPVPKRVIRIAEMKDMSVDQVIEHYEVEKALATRLRNSTRAERIEQRLYTSIYDEMLRKVPYHTMLEGAQHAAARSKHVAGIVRFLSRYLTKDMVFLEIGAGDCKLSSQIARRVRKVYALDVSEDLTKNAALPDNAELILSDGVSIPVPRNSVDVAYSDQLMEHLHPDDALEQLGNIYDALAEGGTYICTTPNRLIGPRDISAGFDDVATGFHLKEYLPSELSEIFRQAGFSKRYLLQGYKQRVSWSTPIVPTTLPVFRTVEKILGILPFPVRSIGAKTIFKGSGMTVIGVK